MNLFGLHICHEEIAAFFGTMTFLAPLIAWLKTKWHKRFGCNPEHEAKPKCISPSINEIYAARSGGGFAASRKSRGPSSGPVSVRKQSRHERGRRLGRARNV